ncbi:MAG TPA: MBL fold metallo-hydrolase [Steroidobacteraceae bacterium]|nr:MBL fold metallo-hydrolase [Steroidobacteraceae bacterium]
MNPIKPRRRTAKPMLTLSVALSMIALAALGLIWRAPEAAAWLWRARAGTPAMTSVKPVLAVPLHWFDDYYVVEDMGEGAFAIGEPLYGQCNFSYLIVGAERALLFDSGPGVRNIAPVVRALTALPVEVLPSHLHFDHTGNLRRFDDIALPDLPQLRRQVRDGVFSLGFYQSLGFIEGFKRLPFRVSRWLTLGSVIDLGQRRLVPIGVPGHTPESVVLFDYSANRVYAGDFIYPSEIYAFLPGADLSDYAASARRIYAMVNDQTRIYGAHGCDRPPLVDVPMLNKSDVGALAAALTQAATTIGPVGTGWFPRVLPVNGRMTLLATYPWMSR